jgi:hypothetical protein
VRSSDPESQRAIANPPTSIEFHQCHPEFIEGRQLSRQPANWEVTLPTKQQNPPKVTKPTTCETNLTFVMLNSIQYRLNASTTEQVGPVRAT